MAQSTEPIEWHDSAILRKKLQKEASFHGSSRLQRTSISANQLRKVTPFAGTMRSANYTFSSVNQRQRRTQSVSSDAPYYDQMIHNRKLKILSDPLRKSKEIKQLLQEEFLPPLPHISRTRSTGGFFISREIVHQPINGRKKHRSTTKGFKVVEHFDRHEIFHSVTEKEMNKGLLHLINRKVVPRSIDLTEFMTKEPTPIIAEMKQLQSIFSKNERRVYLTGADARNDILLPGLKFDLQIADDTQDAKKHSRNIIDTSLRKRMPKKINIVTMEHTMDNADEEQVVEQQNVVDEHPRSYNQLLDEYSLHNVIIHRGKTLKTTPEFISFQRMYQDIWYLILPLLDHLEGIMSEYRVPLAVVDGKRLARLAMVHSGQPSIPQFLDCVFNVEAVYPHINIPELRFFGPSGMENAAIVIQKTFRMYHARRYFEKLKKWDQCAKKIQEFWTIRRHYFRTKQLLKEKYQEEENEWRKIMENFCKNWNKMKTGKRMIVHIPSVSLDVRIRPSVPKFLEMQCSQLARLCDLEDPNVEILLVTPFPIDDDGLQYMIKILNVGGVYDIEKRLSVVHTQTENYYFSSNGSSLSTSLLLSTRTLRNIKSICAGKNAYIVPGICDSFDFRIAFKLRLPILGPDPATASVYASKSGAKRIFQIAEVNVSPGVCDIYEENDVYLHLAKQIASHPGYARWFIKIDNEFGGRGLAYLDTSLLHCLTQNGLGDITNELKRHGTVDSFVDILRDRIFFELKANMSHIIKICTPFVYPDWSAFLSSIQCHGAIIEAMANNVISSPTVNILVEPNGAVQIQSIQEQLMSPQFCSYGASFPPMSDVPYEALHSATQAIAEICFSRKILGYLSIDFVVFMAQDKTHKLWAVDMKNYQTDNALFHRVFHFVTGSKMLQENRHSRSYIYSGLLRHPALHAWQTGAFFERCQLSRMTYDTDSRTGTVFQLTDSLSRGMLGVLCIAKSPAESFTLFSDIINAIASQIKEDLSDDVATFESNIHCVFHLVKRLVLSFNNGRQIK